MGQNQQYRVAQLASIALVVSLIGVEVGIVMSSPYLGGIRFYEFCMISLFAIIGATCGWLLGVIASPRGDQGKRFTLVSSAVGTLFSGFLLGQLNKTNWQVMDSSGGHGIVLIRAAFAVGWFIIALSITFLTRSFEDENSPPRTSPVP
jgi:uncharacterized membrane protein YeaQ/YmgE (transglycosylase-associated protein family)